MNETEAAAKTAQSAIGEARIFLNAKLAIVKRLENEKVRGQATAELAKLQAMLQEAQAKLNPLKSVRQDFAARQAANKVVDEILEKLTTAEMDCDKAEEASDLLSGAGLSKETLTAAEAAMRKATKGRRCCHAVHPAEEGPGRGDHPAG